MAGRRTIVYIDGFNLYYGALRDRPDCKWLDPWAWSESLLSLDERLILVRYFTARVGGRAVDPEAPQRQEIYLRALSSRAMEVVVHEGHFETETEEWPLASDPDGERVEVLVSEEKGSDVNLATYLMFDAFEGAMDVAIVVSDDFDLEEPMVLARDAYGIGLCVVSPRRTRKLANAVRAESWRPVREEQLLATQFPELVVGSDGHEVFRPPAWRTPRKWGGRPAAASTPAPEATGASDGKATNAADGTQVFPLVPPFSCVQELQYTPPRLVVRGLPPIEGALMSRLISTFRQRIEARDLPFVAGDWFQVHLGIALGRLGRHSSWVRDFLSTAEEVRPTIRPTT